MDSVDHETKEVPLDEFPDRPQRQFSAARTLLLTSILVIAGITSALTAMRLAIRGREVVVPELRGKAQEEAERILTESGLILKVTGKRFSRDVPESRILEQMPTSGSRLKLNRSVKVLVSLGERRFPVPNLLGSSLRASQLNLAQRGLTLGRTLYAHTPEGESSTVVYQYPRPGSQGGSDPSVSVLVSLGPVDQYYIMPDLIGQPAESAVARIQTEGFRLGKISRRKYPGVEGGVVIQQQPQAGYRVSSFEAIHLEVSQ